MSNKLSRGLCRTALLGGALACGPFSQAQTVPDPPPKPTFELGVGLTRTPGWMGDARSVVHATGWANAEYLSKALGRFQVNGGSLTMDPTLNWDPWVEGIASFGFLVGYHDNAALGEGRNPRVSGSVSGLDGGVQAVVPVLGAPLFAQARKAFGRDQGWLLVLGSYLPIHPVKTVTVAFLPTARWLDRKQGQLSFSAPAAQDFQGGSAAYVGTAGFQDVSLEVIVDWQLDQRWHWVSSVSQRWLMGSAAQTPLVAATTQRGLSSGLSIHF